MPRLLHLWSNIPMSLLFAQTLSATVVKLPINDLCPRDQFCGTTSSQDNFSFMWRQSCVLVYTHGRNSSYIYTLPMLCCFPGCFCLHEPNLSRSKSPKSLPTISQENHSFWRLISHPYLNGSATRGIPSLLSQCSILSCPGRLQVIYRSYSCISRGRFGMNSGMVPLALHFLGIHSW